MEKELIFKKVERFHDKYYKQLLFIPIAILILSLFYLTLLYSNTGDFIHKDISLTGGTSITIYENIDADKLKLDLSDKFEEINTREVYDLLTREKKAIIIETKTEGEEVKEILEEYLGYKLDEKNSSFEFTGSALSENFYRQLIVAIFFAFIFMALVVFIIFRKIVPSVAVIISAFADIVMTLALVDILGIKMSSAGIVAFLMLIGYSVDTDILLTNRVLKSNQGTLNERIFGAFKTGITMTLTSFLAVLIALIVSISFSVVLTQIFTVLVIGLGFDILNTWITNVSLLKWYVKKNEN
ncbi:MAG: protein translocase subunit SecF [Nanoarchaeota archaeon]|nr:protein translocase subunit SecF [Nanoarchaeota archaeon]